MLQPGDFVAVGPALSRSPAVVRIGPVQTEHRGAAPAIPEPQQFAPGRAAELLDLDALMETSQADAEIRAASTLMPGLKAVRGLLRDPAFDAAGRVWSALRPLAPEGAKVGELGPYLGLSDPDVTGGLALLDGFGVLEFSGEGDDRAVRLERGMQS